MGEIEISKAMKPIKATSRKDLLLSKNLHITLVKTERDRVDIVRDILNELEESKIDPNKVNISDRHKYSGFIVGYIDANQLKSATNVDGLKTAILTHIKHLNINMYALNIDDELVSAIISNEPGNLIYLLMLINRTERILAITSYSSTQMSVEVI
jgi:hypothetical protein